jgi:GMP synthase (glutamine-hydrolysing)
MILIIDNRSQYSHLIKRKCRDFGFEIEKIMAHERYQRFEEMLFKGIEKIILTGGPGSIYEDPDNMGLMIVNKILNDKLDIPIFGICYGHQTIGYAAGAEVDKGKNAEYGISEIYVTDEDTIFQSVPDRFNAWVSHYDEVKEVPKGFRRLAYSDECGVEAMCHNKKPIYSVQFHPEVWHTDYGEKMLKNFLIDPDELANI